MSELNMKRIEELFDSEAFQQTLKEVSTVEDMIRVFAENGLEITAEDAEQFLQGRKEGLEKDELAVDELDAVAGGKSRCFFHGFGDGLIVGKQDSDSGFWYDFGYAIGKLFR